MEVTIAVTVNKVATFRPYYLLLVSISEFLHSEDMKYTIT